MATLTLDLFTGPAVELRRVVEAPRASWVDRILQSRGAGPDSVPVSCALEAAGEALARRLDTAAMVARKSEARGWAVELAGDQVRITTAAGTDATRDALQADGVWHVAQRLAAHDVGEPVLR